MMPLGDDNSTRKNPPLITLLLVGLNILVFLAELAGGEAFVLKWAFIPARFTAQPIANFITLFTSMFMHAGLMHLVGNMLYLWIFGDNVEDQFGKARYLCFYLVCGLGATFAQYLVSPLSQIPNVGASGAIAGILGAYILLYPKQKIRVLLGSQILALPSSVVIGFWIFLQLFSGIGTVGSADVGGVAYMAHIGGFITGFLIAFLTSKLLRS